MDLYYANKGKPKDFTHVPQTLIEDSMEIKTDS